MDSNLIGRFRMLMEDDEPAFNRENFDLLISVARAALARHNPDNQEPMRPGLLIDQLQTHERIPNAMVADSDHQLAGTNRRIQSPESAVTNADTVVQQKSHPTTDDSASRIRKVEVQDLITTTTTSDESQKQEILKLEGQLRELRTVNERQARQINRMGPQHASTVYNIYGDVVQLWMGGCVPSGNHASTLSLHEAAPLKKNPPQGTSSNGWWEMLGLISSILLVLKVFNTPVAILFTIFLIVAFFLS
jgi:hypothetical protein